MFLKNNFTYVCCRNNYFPTDYISFCCYFLSWFLLFQLNAYAAGAFVSGDQMRFWSKIRFRKLILFEASAYAAGAFVFGIKCVFKKRTSVFLQKNLFEASAYAAGAFVFEIKCVLWIKINYLHQKTEFE